MDRQHFQLVSALTEYDRRQSKKKGHNPYALAHYMKAIQDAEMTVASGHSWRAAVVDNFCGRLLDVALKAIGETKSTDGEQRMAARGRLDDNRIVTEYVRTID